MQKTITKHLITIETGVAAGSLLLMLTLSLLQIFIRNAFNFGYPEIDILNRHLLVVCGMMGAVLASSQLIHIKIDALVIFLKPKQRLQIQPIIKTFAVLTCATLCYYSVIFCIDEYQYAPPNERWLLPFTYTYPVCFALMSFHFLFSPNQEKNKAPS